MGCIYKLKSRIVDESEIVNFKYYEQTKMDMVLSIDKDYNIFCYSSDNYVYYTHMKNNKIIKICVYEREI